MLYISSLRVNLVSLGVLYREDISIQSTRLRLVIEVRDEELFHVILAGQSSTLYHI